MTALSTPAVPTRTRLRDRFRTGPLPWGTVVLLAVVVSFGDGAILVALRGAVGAIERTQGPFASWLQDSALLLPVFALVFTWAFARGRRKGRRLLGTALLLVAAGSLVSVAELTVSTAYDYHLQSDLLARTSALHDHAIGAGSAPNPAYADSGWTPEQRETVQLDVKAVGYGTGLVVGANLLLVGWVVALRGGRLDVRRR